MRYISKGIWFDKGTEAKLKFWCDEDHTIALFKGYRTCINPGAEAEPLGKTYLDEEICNIDEFEVVE